MVIETIKLKDTYFFEEKLLQTLLFSHSVLSGSVRPHRLQHARLPVLYHLPEFAQIQRGERYWGIWGPQGAAEIQSAGETPSFLSPVGPWQQERGSREQPPLTQASLSGELRAGGTQAHPGPGNTCPPSLEPLCSFHLLSSSTSGKHRPPLGLRVHIWAGEHLFPADLAPKS